MPDHKSRPDVLADVLDGVAAVEAPAMQPARGGPSRDGEPASARQGTSARWQPGGRGAARWECLIVSFQNYRGWRPRFINGDEVADWARGPVVHEFINQMGEEGWEVAAAAAGQPLYGAADHYQVYLKREKK